MKHPRLKFRSGVILIATLLSSCSSLPNSASRPTRSPSISELPSTATVIGVGGTSQSSTPRGEGPPNRFEAIQPANLHRLSEIGRYEPAVIIDIAWLEDDHQLGVLQEHGLAAISLSSAGGMTTNSLDESGTFYNLDFCRPKDLLAVQKGNFVEIWKLPNLSSEAIVRGIPVATLAMEFSPDCSTLAFAGLTTIFPQFAVFESRSLIGGEGFGFSDEEFEQYRCLAFSSDGSLLAICRNPSDLESIPSILIIEPRHGSTEHTVSVPGSSLFDIHFASQDSIIVLGTDEGTHLLHVNTWEAEPFAKSTEQVWAVELDAKGLILLTGGDQGTFRAWDFHSRSLVRQLDLSAPVKAISISPNGTFIAVAGIDYVSVLGVEAER